MRRPSTGASVAFTLPRRPWYRFVIIDQWAAALALAPGELDYEVLRLASEHVPKRAAARYLSISRRTLDRSLNRTKRRAERVLGPRLCSRDGCEQELPSMREETRAGVPLRASSGGGAIASPPRAIHQSSRQPLVTRGATVFDGSRTNLTVPVLPKEPCSRTRNDLPR